MSKGPHRFPTSQLIASYIEAAKAEGATEICVESGVTKIRILLQPAPPENDFDRELAEFERRVADADN
jgi:hypothetical protein